MLDPLTAALLIFRLPETGVATYWQLVKQFSTAAEALLQPAEKLKHCLKPAALEALINYRQDPQGSPLATKLAVDLAYLEAQPDLHCIMFDNAYYPDLLRHISKPPPLLYVRGNPQCLALPQIAIVGSRAPTPSGQENAQWFAHQLVEQGFAITSGLALGVDAAAHQGALAGSGITLAIMGTGIDLIYPSRHRNLAQQIVANGGALISEFPLGTPSRANHFPQRNRIISGLSYGTLIVEAAPQSGSLITASYALQQNREVFAIPGSIHNPLAKGCHQLIRQGAALVENVQDILNELTGTLSFRDQHQECVDFVKNNAPLQQIDIQKVDEILSCEQSHILNFGEQVLYDAMGYDPVTLDMLVARTSLTAGAIAANLIGLELAGLIQQHSGTYQRAK